MRKLIVSIGTTIFLGCTVFALNCDAATPPLSVFFSKPAIGAVALSPSGNTLAITVLGSRGRMELAIADLNQKPFKLKIAGWLPDYDIGTVQWVNDKRMVFQAYDSQAGEWAHSSGLWAVDADGQNGQLLIDPKWGGFRLLHVTKANNVLPGEWSLAGLPMDGSDDVLVTEASWASGGRFKALALARLNTRRPSPVRLTSGAPDGARAWITDDASTPRWVQTLVGEKRGIFRRERDTWEPVASFNAIVSDGWQPRFLINDQLFVSIPRGPSAESQLALFNPKTNQPESTPILAATGFDVGDSARPLIDRASKELLGWRYVLDTTYTKWINPVMLAQQERIDKAIPFHVNVIACQNCLDAKRWLVTSLSDREPPVFSLFEVSTGRVEPLGSQLPDFDAHTSGERTFHRIKARDGADLPVYVTQPAQRSTKPAPVVVYVHGGPASRVDRNFSLVPQFLASRGYLVIEPEFRGSAGYGGAHELAGWRQWGLTMQDDLQDALQWAVQQKMADPARACIMGASYGGYAALMGAARDSASYRCAISWVGVTDLPELLGETRFPWDSGNLKAAAQDLSIGNPQKDEARLKQTSPVHRAGDIKIPVLAAWGADDQRVPVEQGRRFRAAAAKAGVDLEYIEYAGEGHNWLKPETSIDFFGRVEKLLAKTIGDK